MTRLSSYALTIGVDIGGTKIAMAVVDGEGRIVDKHRVETPATDPAALRHAIAKGVRTLQENHRVMAIGVAAAGFVNSERSTVLFAPNINWRDEDLKTELERELSLPVVVENDANAAGWAEFAFGGGRHVSNMALLTIGTGLGGALVVDGHLIRGAYGVAAELGHLRIVPDGLHCGCGNRGCWEQYASGNALTREAQLLAKHSPALAGTLLEAAGGNPDDITGEIVSAAARDGDGPARELLSDLGGWLGLGVAQLATIMDPAVVVIGGGASAASDFMIPAAMDSYRRNLPARGQHPELTINVAELGNDAGVIGAADLARTH